MTVTNVVVDCFGLGSDKTGDCFDAGFGFGAFKPS